MSRFMGGLSAQIATAPLFGNGTLPSKARPVSERLHESAVVLARRIESGEFSELLPEQRTELRRLTMAMSSLAGQVEAMEQERDDAHRSARRRDEKWGVFGAIVRRFRGA